MRSLFKEPLFQFLFIALLLLLGERLINADDYAYDQYHIEVDNSVLLQFMQLRAKTFKPEEAQQALDALSTEDRQRLVDDYAREEALFRDAMALNLDKNDQIIRRRLIQKMDYLAQGFYDEVEAITEDDLRDYYTEHREEYKKLASATFTHVFVSSERHGAEQLKPLLLNCRKASTPRPCHLKMPPVTANAFSITAITSIATMTKSVAISVPSFKSNYLLLRSVKRGRVQCSQTMVGT
jgi:peptidyl-prolyl cis-trans isomerase C